MSPTSFSELELLDRLSAVEQALQSADPALGTHLSAIHKSLLANEELIHILPDEKIAIIFKGLQQWKGISLVKSATTKRSTKQTADDF